MLKNKFFQNCKKAQSFLFGIVLTFGLVACAGVKSDDPDAINNALVGFTTCAQSERWAEALQYITPSEADAISDGSVFKEEYQKASMRLNLSAMRRMKWTVDEKGRLIGIRALMDQTNSRYVVSEEQATIGTKDYFEKQEQRHIQRKLDEGRRIMEEEANRDDEPKVEVMTNRLTDEEKRKYGSTGELMAPEEYSDANTQAAEASMSGSSNEDTGYYGDSESAPSDAESSEAPAEEGYYGE